MAELAATKPGVAKRRRVANQKSLLLSLPQELLIMIFREVFDDMLEDCCDHLHLQDGGWISPPILQTCHELRAVGLEEWMMTPGRFICDNLDATDIIERDKWCREMRDIYGVEDPGKSRCLDLSRPNDTAAAKQNLLQWLQYVYGSGREGVYIQEDFDMDDPTWYEENYTWYTVRTGYVSSDIQCQVARVFLSSNRMYAQGASWAKFEEVIEPTLDLILR